VRSGDAKDDLEKAEHPAVADASANDGNDNDDNDEKKSIREISRVHSKKSELAKDDAATERTRTDDISEVVEVKEK
jgi:hypothetical protein